MSGGGGGSSEQTAGFRYFFGIHMGVCRNADEIVEIRVGDRTAWTGAVNSNTSVDIDAYELFGGEDGEGGVRGKLDFMFGGQSQLASEGLSNMLLASDTSLISLTGRTVESNDSYSGAGVRLDPDGTLLTFSNGNWTAVNGQWVAGNKLTNIGSNYEVLFESNGTSSGWQVISQSRSFTSGDAARDVVVSIRTLSGMIAAVATFNLVVQQ